VIVRRLFTVANVHKYMPQVFLGLGSNLGDRRTYLREAIRLLREAPCIHKIRCSSVYESEAHTHDDEEAPPFLNAVVGVETSCSPEELWLICQRIEAHMGRRRVRKWAPRTLDIDVLLYDDQVIHTQQLQIPHPRMLERRFVLEPLAELAPEARIPVGEGIIVQEALARCSDKHAIQKLEDSLC